MMLNSLTHWSHIHVFRLNLNNVQLVLLNPPQQHASVDEFAKLREALIVINAGFFDERFKPLGLRISERKQLSPLKNISWWGVFYVKHKKAQITSAHNFHASPDITFAVQAGPRLLINKKIPSLKAGYAERTALGLTEKGEIILVVTEHAPLSTTDLAEIMRSAPLNCVDALNLDGGSSSQLHAHFDSFQINTSNLVQVADAIAVIP